MNKIMKLTPILLVLVLVIAINPGSATKYIDTHIQGLHNVTVHQGEKFTLHIKVEQENGRGICTMFSNSVHLYIDDLNNYRVYRHDVGIPRFCGNDITVDTSNLPPGTYTMIAAFDGRYDPTAVKQFNGCSKYATLTVLPNTYKDSLDDLLHIWMDPAKHVPLANNMSLNTSMDMPLKGVFNATDPEGNILNIIVLSNPKHGYVTVNGTKFMYVPKTGYIGNDSFTYNVKDKSGLISNNATVNIQVIDNILNVTAESFTLYLTKNRPDNMEIISDYDVVIVQPPLHGTATVENNGYYPIIHYVPFRDYTGNDSYSYRLQSSDGKMSNIAWIRMTIRDWPI